MLTADEKVKELQEILESKNLEMDEMRVHMESSMTGSQQQFSADKNNLDQALMQQLGPNANSKEIKRKLKYSNQLLTIKMCRVDGSRHAGSFKLIKGRQPDRVFSHSATQREVQSTQHAS